MKKLTDKEKIEHASTCEFHLGRKLGDCPIVSRKQLKQLRKSQ